MERRFNTRTLLLLREQRYENLSFTDDSMAETLKRARLDYKAIPGPSNFSTVSDSKPSLNIFRQLWSALAKLNEKHILYIPPIYESPTVNELLLDVVHGVRVREFRDGIFDTGHPIFGGVEGTGKTTLIKALAIAVAVCSENYFFAFVDFQQSIGEPIPTPHRIFAEIFLQLSTELNHYRVDGKELKEHIEFTISKKSLEQLLDHCQNKFALKVGIIVDEVQTVFEVKSISKNESQKALASYQNFARHNLNSMIILTGSSIKLRQYLFRCPNELPDYKNYLNFNKSLIKFYSIHALRHHDEIKRYICHRYPDILQNRDEEYINEMVPKIFYYTGGIGRNIHAYVVGGKIDTVKSIENISNLYEFRVFLNILRYYQTKNKVLENIISNKDVTLEQVTTDKVCIPIKTAADLMGTTYCIENPNSLFDTWTDSGYLYADNSDIHLIKPIDAIDYYRDSASPDDYLRLFCVYIMVKKGNIKVGAGFPLEHLVFPRITYFNWKSNYTGYLVDTSSNQLRIHWNSVLSPLILSEDNVTELHEKAFKWEKEQGVDGIQVHVDVNNKVITLDLWQCKGGSIDGSINGGNISTYRKKKMRTDDDDDYIANIIAKAERGAMILGRAFLKCLPQWKFKIGSFLITTTKKTELAEIFLQNCGYREIITEDWLNIGINDADISPRYLREPYQIILHSGIDWFLNMLEPELHRLWPV